MHDASTHKMCSTGIYNISLYHCRYYYLAHGQLDPEAGMASYIKHQLQVALIHNIARSYMPEPGK